MAPANKMLLCLRSLVFDSCSSYILQGYNTKVRLVSISLGPTQCKTDGQVLHIVHNQGEDQNA